MKEKEIDDLKKNITERLQVLKHQDVINADGFSDLLKTIHSLKSRDRKNFKNIYEKIYEVAFRKGITLDEYDPERYFENKRATKKPTSKAEDKEKKSEKILLLYHKAKSRFKFFPRHIFLNFMSDEDNPHKLILLYNHDTEPKFLKKIKQEITKAGSDCKVFQLDDFIKGLEDSELRDNNYIAFFTFKIKSNAQKYIDDKFFVLNGYFDISEIIYGEYEEGYTYNKDISSIKKKLEYFMMVEFINMELNYHELKVMKLLFGATKTNQIHYRLNTKGFSGSKVISVQPFSYVENPQIFIIKISDKDKEKLQKEKDKFHEFVHTYDAAYSIDYKETEECFAIKYHYATSDSQIESSSFGDILNNSDMYPLDKRINYVKKLFDTNIYSRWDDSQNDDVNISYSYYKDYINLEEIKKKLLKIYDCQSTDDLKIIKIFNKIKALNIQGKTQISHGDLHTENFFIDDQERVFLIDFGDVKFHHNMIDYAMLETSIKLNHIPNYIPNDRLFEIEKELLEPTTFNSNYKFKNIERSDLNEIYSLVTCIRELASSKFVNMNEYYYSLFMLTFRQIRYPDLNQLYAIEIAKLIGEKLIKEN